MAAKFCNCGGDVVYVRRYSGEALCSSCFKDSIVAKTRRTIARYGMLKRGQRVGVAVSGGKDSLSLLKVLHQLRESLGIELVAVSVDEGVAGYRDEALENASRVAADLHVEHLTVSYQELFGFSLDRALGWKDDRDVSSCSFCGVFRRRAIDEAAARAGADVIATAHNLDDYVQTFLMNLLHGDVERISWLNPALTEAGLPSRRAKPFLEVYEEEVALFAFLSGIPFQSVSCPYMHEGMRTEVRDFLNQMEAGHSGMKNVLLRAGLDVIERMTASTKTFMACRVCGKPSSAEICNVCRMKEEINRHVNYSA